MMMQEHVQMMNKVRQGCIHNNLLHSMHARPQVGVLVLTNMAMALNGPPDCVAPQTSRCSAGGGLRAHGHHHHAGRAPRHVHVLSLHVRACQYTPVHNLICDGA